jgi:hypothetical protein
MSFTWNYTSSSAETQKKWSRALQRDLEKENFFAPLIYDVSDNIPTDTKATQGIIKQHNDLRGKNNRGNSLVVYNVANSTGKPVIDDATLAGSGGPIDTYTQEISLSLVAYEHVSRGVMSEKRVPLDFRREARTSLSGKLQRCLEEGLMLHLSGTNTFVNTNIKSWASGDTIFGNAVQTFDSDHIKYVTGSSDANVAADNTAKLSAAVLDSVITKASDTLDIPVEPLRVDGEDLFLFLCSYEGLEQLFADQRFREAQQYAAPRGKENPLLGFTKIRYRNLLIKPYAKIVKPIANAAYNLLLGKDALHVLPGSESVDWIEDFEDRKRKPVVATQMMLGAQGCKFNGTRRNAVRVVSYVS